MGDLGSSINLESYLLPGAALVALAIFLIFALFKARKRRQKELQSFDKEESKQDRQVASDLDKPLPESAPKGIPETIASSSPETQPKTPGVLAGQDASAQTPIPTPEVPEKASTPQSALLQSETDTTAAAPSPHRDLALVSGLAKTRSGWIAKLGKAFAGKREIDAQLLEEIERTLLTADIGVRTSQSLIEEIKTSLSKKELSSPETIWKFLRERSCSILQIDAEPIDFTRVKPFVLLVIGVNGSGKTTTIGKLASQLVSRNLKVMLAAGDTFRAAATEQLEIWGRRVGAQVVKGKEAADPSSVLFDAIKKGSNEDIDVIICDTAGRLHTKADLMDELQKLRRVVSKACPGAPHETWLVIDATNGQNAIAQAQIFTEAMSVSGVVLTKLDGTAKGGVILGIADQLKLPVRYIGVGEKAEDLKPFLPMDFVEALFDHEATS